MIPLFAVLLELTLSSPPAEGGSGQDPLETVVISCPGLRCAECQLGVIRGSARFPGIRSVEFDASRALLTLRVERGFDRHHELITELQKVADPIEMFRATLVEPRQIFLYCDGPLDPETGVHLVSSLKAVPGVKSVYLDPRRVLSVTVASGTDRARLRECVRRLGC